MCWPSLLWSSLSSFSDLTLTSSTESTAWLWPSAVMSCRGAIRLVRCGHEVKCIGRSALANQWVALKGQTSKTFPDLCWHFVIWRGIRWAGTLWFESKGQLLKTLSLLWSFRKVAIDGQRMSDRTQMWPRVETNWDQTRAQRLVRRPTDVSAIYESLNALSTDFSVDSRQRSPENTFVFNYYTFWKSVNFPFDWIKSKPQSLSSTKWHNS